MPPMHHVRTDGVAPAHVSPHISLRVVLVEEMVFALVINEPVGIVHEILGRSEMKLGPPRFVIADVPERNACNEKKDGCRRCQQESLPRFSDPVKSSAQGFVSC